MAYKAMIIAANGNIMKNIAVTVEGFSYVTRGRISGRNNFLRDKRSGSDNGMCFREKGSIQDYHRKTCFSVKRRWPWRLK